MRLSASHVFPMGHARTSALISTDDGCRSETFPTLTEKYPTHYSPRTHMNKSLLLASLVAAVALAACGKKEEAPAPAPAPAAAPAPMPAPVAEAASAAASAVAGAADAAASAVAGAATLGRRRRQGCRWQGDGRRRLGRQEVIQLPLETNKPPSGGLLLCGPPTGGLLLCGPPRGGPLLLQPPSGGFRRFRPVRQRRSRTNCDTMALPTSPLSGAPAEVCTATLVLPPSPLSTTR